MNPLEKKIYRTSAFSLAYLAVGSSQGSSICFPLTCKSTFKPLVEVFKRKNRVARCKINVSIASHGNSPSSFYKNTEPNFTIFCTFAF